MAVKRATYKVMRDTAANWASFNPVLYSGQFGLDTTNSILKIGDGTTAWSSLPSMPVDVSAYMLTLLDDADADAARTTLVAQKILYVLHVREEQAANTAGGTFTSGAWRTRVLNTSKTNTISGASLGSNQITLPAGTYSFECRAPAYYVNRHKTRLYNISDSADSIIGSSEFSYNTGAAHTSSFVRGVVTIAAQKIFELQHYCETTRATDGLGLASNMDSKVEVYAEVFITKLA